MIDKGEEDWLARWCCACCCCCCCSARAATRSIWSEKKDDTSGDIIEDDRLVFFSNDADSEYLAYDENNKWRVNVMKGLLLYLSITSDPLVHRWSTMEVLDTFDNYLNTEV